MTIDLPPPADSGAVARPFASFQMRVDVRLFQTSQELACRQDPELFFNARRRHRAIKQCAECPFRGRCGYNAVATGATHGVWGGVMLPGDYPQELKPLYAFLAAQFEQRREAELGDVPVAPLPDVTDDSETDHQLLTFRSGAAHKDIAMNSVVLSRHRVLASVDDHDSTRHITAFHAAKQDSGRGKPRLAAPLRWAILAGTALSLLLTGCTATATGHPAAAPDLGRWQPPAILPQHLADLLLNENDVNTIGHTTAMAVRKPFSKMWHDEDLVSNPSCLDVYSPAEATVYQGSNWTAVQGQILDDAAPAAPEHALIQALIGFRDADSAQQFFSQAKTRWSGCANRSITVAPPGHAPITWNLGEPQATDTTVATIQTQPGGHGPTCQRAMGLANNVIVDTLWCGFDTTSQASGIVSKTTAAVSQA